MSPALRAYLAWQAELGTDEVMLPSPIRARTDATPRTAAGPAQTPKEFFLSLAETLEPPAPEPVPVPAPARLETQFPVFAGLEDYWTWMEANGAAAHGGEGPLIRSTGPRHAPLAVIGLEPGAADRPGGRVFQGGPGELLDKMLRAIHLDRPGLYCACLVKMAPEAKTWSRRELARLTPLLQMELDLAQPSLILLLGEACAQALLKTGKGLEELRAGSHTLGGRECLVTYHPEELLRNEELKRKAWEDLKRLKARLPGGVSA